MVTAGDIIRASRIERAETGESEISIIQRRSEAAVNQQTQSTPRGNSGGSSPTPPPPKVSLPFPANLPKTTPKQAPSTQTMILTNEGRILSITPTLISGDELQVTVRVNNPTQTTQKYRVYLYDSSGNLIDKEPDTYWNNVSAGRTETITVSTNWKYFDVGDLGQKSFRISLYAQGGVLLDEKIGNISTGKVSTPQDRTIGTLKSPKSAPDIKTSNGNTFGDTQTGFSTPSFDSITKKETSFFDPFTKGKFDIGDTGVAIAAVILAYAFIKR